MTDVKIQSSGLLVEDDRRQNAAHLHQAVRDALLLVSRAVFQAVYTARPPAEQQLCVGQQKLATRAARHALGVQLEHWWKFRRRDARPARRLRVLQRHLPKRRRVSA